MVAIKVKIDFYYWAAIGRIKIYKSKLILYKNNK